MPWAERAIVTVASPSYAPLLDDLLASLRAYGGCPDAQVVVIAPTGDARCAAVAARHGAYLAPWRQSDSPQLPACLIRHAAARIVAARQMLYLDADMLVLDDLSPIFSMLSSHNEDVIFACREGHGRGYRDLGHALRELYAGDAAELWQLAGVTAAELTYRPVINGGLFAGSRQALLRIDATICAMPGMLAWLASEPEIYWRDQFVFNLAMARLRCGIELDETYNLQLNAQEVQLASDGARLYATWCGRAVRVLHFNARGRHKLLDWRPAFRASSAGHAPERASDSATESNQNAADRR